MRIYDQKSHIRMRKDMLRIIRHQTEMEEVAISLFNLLCHAG